MSRGGTKCLLKVLEEVLKLRFFPLFSFFCSRGTLLVGVFLKVRIGPLLFAPKEKLGSREQKGRHACLLSGSDVTIRVRTLYFFPSFFIFLVNLTRE